MNSDQRKKIKEKYRSAYLAARQIINDIDPIGLIDLCGPEEYDIEVIEILPKLRNCSSEQEIRKMVIEVFTKYFDDPGNIELYNTVGEKLFEVKLHLERES